MSNLEKLIDISYQTDTVGVCSLRVEHIKLLEELISVNKRISYESNNRNI